jgi:hypothetical protein
MASKREKGYIPIRIQRPDNRNWTVCAVPGMPGGPYEYFLLLNTKKNTQVVVL